MVWEGAEYISYRVVECGGASSCIPPCRAGGGEEWERPTVSPGGRVGLHVGRDFRDKVDKVP